MFKNTYSKPSRTDELLSRVLLGSIAALVLVSAAGWSDESGATHAVQLALSRAPAQLAAAEPPVIVSQAEIEPR